MECKYFPNMKCVEGYLPDDCGDLGKDKGKDQGKGKKPKKLKECKYKRVYNRQGKKPLSKQFLEQW